MLCVSVLLQSLFIVRKPGVRKPGDHRRDQAVSASGSESAAPSVGVRALAFRRWRSGVRIDGARYAAQTSPDGSISTQSAGARNKLFGSEPKQLAIQLHLEVMIGKHHAEYE
jgi:hypothetical protein